MADHTCHLRCTNPDCVERTRLELQKVCSERDELRIALNDAIHSPMGVVPVSAHPFYDWEAGKVKP